MLGASQGVNGAGTAGGAPAGLRLIGKTGHRPRFSRASGQERPGMCAVVLGARLHVASLFVYQPARTYESHLSLSLGDSCPGARSGLPSPGAVICRRDICSVSTGDKLTAGPPGEGAWHRTRGSHLAWEVLQTNPNIFMERRGGEVVGPECDSRVSSPVVADGLPPAASRSRTGAGQAPQ